MRLGRGEGMMPGGGAFNGMTMRMTMRGLSGGIDR
jgi:hypothetical protein